jgi:hypothetical protein
MARVPDGGMGSTTRVLLQLCGEVLVAGVPTRQPPIVRSGAAVGLELLDLLLTPHHVLRINEELTLRNTWVVERRVQLDVSLDRLSRQSEEGATLLSTLISGHHEPSSGRGRPGGGGGRGGGGGNGAGDRELLWLPLDTVPRPVSASVAIVGDDGISLPRPPQREVRLTLQAALAHILRETLRAHPDVQVDGAPVNVMMRHDDAARWLLQSALLSVCEHGPGSARSAERWQAVRHRLPAALGDDVAGGVPGSGTGGVTGGVTGGGTGDDLVALVDKLARDESVGPAHRTALAVLRDAVARHDALLDLVDLVHREYFVVAGLDRRVRDQSLQFDLPASEALDSSVIKRVDRRSRRMLDPREHNFTVHLWVPLPQNIRQYNLHVRTGSSQGRDPYSEVSLIAALRYDDHPGRHAIDALRTCADELTATADAGDGVTAGRRVAFVASRAAGALDRLGALVDLQDRAADELTARWSQASPWAVHQTVSQLRRVTSAARDRLTTARRCLVRTTTRDDLQEGVRQTAAALRDAASSVEHPLLGMQLVSSELPGEVEARIRIGRSMLVSRTRPRPRTLEVWATVSDEARPYALAAVGPPLVLALMTYLVGALLFDALSWPLWTVDRLGRAVATATPDAVVAVLLLVPAFALTQFRLPGRWSVPGRLRMPSRVFVLGAVGVLGVTATVVATQVGAVGRHPHLVLWTFRTALAAFALWAVWERVASSLHLHYAWRPKGLKPVFGGDEEEPRRRLVPRLVAYDGKAPDAEFDLRLPTRSFPSRPSEPSGPSRRSHREPS